MYRCCCRAMCRRIGCCLWSSTGGLCHAMPWGHVSDHYGRKPVLISGVACSAIAMLVFGSSKNYTQAIIGRMICGLLSGNAGGNKSFMAEITNATNRSLGFSLIFTSWYIGAIIGPLLGGFLSPYMLASCLIMTCSPHSAVCILRYTYLGQMRMHFVVGVMTMLQ